MDDTPRMVTGKLVVGLMVMAVGLAFTLDALHIVDAGSLWRFWPVLVIAHGVNRLTGSGSDDRRHNGMFMVLVGFWLLGNTLDLLAWHSSWPLLVIAVGMSIVWKALPSRRRSSKPEDESHDSLSQDNPHGLL
jgi:hypothetical protein